MQSKRTQKIHQILQQQGYYNLQMPVIKEVLMLLEQPNTIIPMQIRLYTINGFLELTAGQRNNFKKYFFSKKFKPISQSTKMYVTRLAKVIHRMQLAQDLEQKIKNDHSNRQLHCPLVKVPQNQHERLNQENSDNQIQPFTIRLIKKHKKEQQSQMIDEMESKKALQKDNQLKIYSKNTDASVQTDLILLNDEFQTYRLDQKAHLHTQKIDFVQQIQVENQKQQKRIIIERQDKKDIILLKNDVAQLHKQKYILTMNEKNLIQYENMAQPIKQTFLQTNIQNSFSKCICKGSKQQELFYRCFFCKNSYHFSCHNKSAMGYQYQHCPQCTLRQIQPKTQIQEVISQQFFQNANSPFLFKAEYNFKPYQYYCGQKHRQHQIQVRCLKLSSRQEEVNEVSWPNQCQIRLDGQRFFEMASIDDKNFQKRKGFPLKLSEFLYFQEKQIKNLNKVTLELIIKNQQTSTNQQDSSFYLIGVYFTKNLTFENLCTKIQGRVISSNKPYMQNLLSNKIIEDTQIGKITFSLLDPYSWNTIKYPVRGVHCRHGQCFDLETYLNVMYSTRYGNWKCPLCKKTTLMLEKDLLQQSILQKLKQDEGIPQEIVYDSNGKIEVTMFNFKEEDSDQQNEMKPKQKKNKNKKKEQKNKQIKFQEYNQLGIKMYNEYSF